MLIRLEQVRKSALENLRQAKNSREVEELHDRFLGRRGVLAREVKNLGTLSPEERPAAGRLANEVKRKLSAAFSLRSQELKQAGAAVKKEVLFDGTLPGKKQIVGSFHPVTMTIGLIEKIFGELGFRPVRGHEIETEYYNFEALNTPFDHPARDEQDSFYIDDGILLRTQTSPVQIRVMEKETPPVRIVASGKCYRRDNMDASHSSMFHQVEGLMVDEKVTFGDLKGVLKVFAEKMFGSGVKIRFRPDFFPFTEPSADVSVSCIMCGGKGCSSCGKSGWIEILGAGMVDPEVFKKVGYDPEKYTGFAFGMGVERIAMLKYGIDDIRLFLENDIRFLSQF